MSKTKTVLEYILEPIQGESLPTLDDIVTNLKLGNSICSTIITRSDTNYFLTDLQKIRKLLGTLLERILEVERGEFEGTHENKMTGAGFENI